MASQGADALEWIFIGARVYFGYLVYGFMFEAN